MLPLAADVFELTLTLLNWIVHSKVAFLFFQRRQPRSQLTRQERIDEKSIHTSEENNTALHAYTPGFARQSERRYIATDRKKATACRVGAS